MMIPGLNFLFYLLAIALAWLFRMSYLGWLGPYLLAVVIFAPLLLLLLSLPAMLMTSLRLQTPAYCTRGSNARLILHFQAPRFLPLSRVRISLEIDNRFAGERSREPLHFESIVSGTRTVALPTGLCGVLHCRVSQFECCDVLGLLRIRRPCPDAFFCVVMPEPRQADQPVDLDASLQTVVHLKPKYGGGYSEEHDMREYRPGDTVNSIHWKLSAKTDSVIVREPLVRENDEVFLVLSRVGVKDRGLEVLYWLSLELCAMEIPHTIVGDQLYSVGSEQESANALAGIMNVPMCEPCAYDAARARCIFLISAGEVHVR